MTAVAEYQAKAPQPPLMLVQPGPAGPGRPGPELPGRPAAATADSEAMTKLWRAQGNALIRFALKLTLGDRQRAEDIVQETMLRAWRHPEVVGGGANSIRPWLFTVTRHIAIDMWRARSRTEEILEDQQADRPDPAEPIEHALTALDMRAVLAQLTPEHREVIVEMYFHSRSVVEIAEKLGIPAGTVKSRTYYALRQLRRLMSPAPGEPAQATPAIVSRTVSAWPRASPGQPRHHRAATAVTLHPPRREATFSQRTAAARPPAPPCSADQAFARSICTAELCR